MLASDSRDDFQGWGRTSLFLPPGAETPSYATGPRDPVETRQIKVCWVCDPVRPGAL